MSELKSLVNLFCIFDASTSYSDVFIVACTVEILLIICMYVSQGKKRNEMTA